MKTTIAARLAAMGLASLSFGAPANAPASTTQTATAEAQSAQTPRAPAKAKAEQQAVKPWRWAPGAGQRQWHDGIHRNAGWWNKRRWKIKRWSGKEKRK